MRRLSPLARYSCKEEALSPEPLPDDYLEKVKGCHREDVIDIIYSIRADDGAVYSANLPNRGWVPDLPADCIVEGPTMATAAGLRRIAQPPLLPGIAGTLATRLQWVETVVEAAQGCRCAGVARAGGWTRGGNSSSSQVCLGSRQGRMEILDSTEYS